MEELELILRLEKGEMLTHEEMDNNFIFLNNKITSSLSSSMNSLTDEDNIKWDVNENNRATITLTDNRILDNAINIMPGMSYDIIIKQDSTGSRILTFGTNYKWAGGIVPLLSTDPNSVDIFTFISDGTYMYGTAINNFL